MLPCSHLLLHLALLVRNIAWSTKDRNLIYTRLAQLCEMDGEGLRDQLMCATARAGADIFSFGIMEKKMENTVMGYWGYVLG